MADTFTRDSLATYEKAPQKTVPDTTNPFAGAKPAGVADPAAVAAVQAGKVDATPAAKAGREVAATPSGEDDVVIAEDQTDSGDGTSADETADTATATADPGSETETELEVDPAVDARPAPKKGSAAERIVEVLDLAEGYKEYGKLQAARVAELTAENARLAAARATTAAAASADEPSIADEPMPKLADPDVNYDEDRLQAKTEKWIRVQARKEAAALVQQTSTQSEQARLTASVNAKLTSYAEKHPDFEEVALKNPVLVANQLSPVASLAVARSEHTAEILDKFGRDTALAVRTAKLSPEEQLLIVGRVIGDIEREKAAAAAKTPQPGAKPGVKKSITQAPPPPRATPAAGRASERDIQDPDVEMDDFARRHREAKQSARAQARKGRGLA